MATRPTGLPSRVDPKNPEQVRQVLERLIEFVRILNGEGGDPELRAVTLKELNQRLSQ